jgi:hypothetical protein
MPDVEYRGDLLVGHLERRVEMEGERLFEEREVGHMAAFEIEGDCQDKESWKQVEVAVDAGSMGCWRMWEGLLHPDLKS